MTIGMTIDEGRILESCLFKDPSERERFGDLEMPNNWLIFKDGIIEEYN